MSFLPIRLIDIQYLMKGFGLLFRMWNENLGDQSSMKSIDKNHNIA